jgi:hypothetical protein
MQLPMSNLLLTRDLHSGEGKQNRGGEKHYESNKSVSIKFGNVSSADSLALSEGIKSNSRQSYSYARVTTRRFTSTHAVGIWDLQSSDLSGMNSSAVIPTWGLSRPRVDFLTSNADIHRVFNVDLLDLIPANGSFAKRVSDCDALIKDGHLGADKAEMKEVADQQAPTKGCVKTSDTLKKETLRSYSSAEKIDTDSEEVTTSCSVDLQISHANSLSRKVVR